MPSWRKVSQCGCHVTLTQILLLSSQGDVEPQDDAAFAAPGPGVSRWAQSEARELRSYLRVTYMQVLSPRGSLFQAAAISTVPMSRLEPDSFLDYDTLADKIKVSAPRRPALCTSACV